MTPLLEVCYPSPSGYERIRYFGKSFYIGRDGHCEIWINHRTVSPQHVYCELRDKQWWVRDCDSQYGVYSNEQPIHEVSLKGAAQFNLGPNGPSLLLTPRLASTDKPMAKTEAEPNTAFETYQVPSEAQLSRLQANSVKRAMQVTARKQTLRYRSGFILLLILLGAVSALAWHQYAGTRKVEELAVDMFYAMKTMELQVVNLQSVLFENYNGLQENYGLKITEQQERLLALQNQYAELMAELNRSKLLLTAEDRLILKVVRQFGESDANAPPEFIAEIKRYIAKWRSTGRLRRGIQRMLDNGYAPVIAQTLKQHQLPIQFLYLALQESGFKVDAVGPKTRYGHAKGMWQFIPETAERYGLSIGPQVDQPIFDDADERHDFAKSTAAAARYLSDIYRTDAQASGLLVAASYNWGEGNIIRLLEQMPANPRERNFWRLLQLNAIPKETYDYVFYIVSAAVIGENPGLFGFDFENPLKSL